MPKKRGRKRDSRAGRATVVRGADAPPSVIFLDVDGVLHPVNARHTKPFDKRCLARLKQVVDGSGGAAIVATSTWRLKPYEFKALKKALTGAGIRGPPVAATPSAAGGRPEEIQIWLRAHPATLAAGRYVILDDLDLAPNAARNALLKGHCVRTNGKTGLVDADVHACLAILRQ